MSVTINIKGLDASLKNIQFLEKKAIEKTQLALNRYAINVENGAVQLAPVDEGHLKGSIHHKFGDLEASVTVGVNYAAYLEFGTRGYAAAYVASLPQDWKTFAATYQGKEGTFEGLLMAITGWVRRKGIPPEAAYPIALKIARNGIRQRPFLYPASQQALPQLTADLKRIFDK